MRNGVQEYEYMRLFATMEKNKNLVDSIVNKVIKQPFGDKSIGKLDVWDYDPEQWDRSRNQLGDLIDRAER